MTANKLIGHQEFISNNGSELTLADLWPDSSIRAAIVGLNPAPHSVNVGHYYQGRAGHRQLLRIAKAGLFDPSSAAFLDDAAVAAGVAFTDIVKTPTPGEKQVTMKQIQAGLPILEEALASRRVPLIICVFRQPAHALLNINRSSPGLLTQRTRWGARVFRMPGPYVKLSDAARAMEQLKDALS
ncbi:uracil-DNA glycosylase family protein [Glutamicibacter sp. X7]